MFPVHKWSQSAGVYVDFKQTSRDVCVCVRVTCFLRVPQDGVVLVHCNAGVSRSASVVIGFLMCQEKMSFDEAFSAVKAARPYIQPNPGFMNQLKKYNPWCHTKTDFVNRDVLFLAFKCCSSTAYVRFHTAPDELMSWNETGVLDMLNILRLWCLGTPGSGLRSCFSANIFFFSYVNFITYFYECLRVHLFQK